MIRSLLGLFALLLMAVSPAHGFEADFVIASDPVLSNPHDIELSSDGKLLYVSDLGNDRVAVLDSDTLKLVGSFGEADDLAAPHDVDLGPGGKLYVADTGNDRIVIYEIDGASGKRIGDITGSIAAPEGVLAHTDGRIYATGAGSGNIVAFADGKPVHEEGGLWHPHDVIATADGQLWVADSSNDRMILMSPKLERLKVLEGNAYKFSGPRYQDMTADGNLVVADKNSHTVKVISPTGEMIKVLGTGKAGKGPDIFTTPEGVVIRDQNLWISDSGNNRIVRYRIQ